MNGIENDIQDYLRILGEMNDNCDKFSKNMRNVTQEKIKLHAVNKRSSPKLVEFEQLTSIYSRQNQDKMKEKHAVVDRIIDKADLLLKDGQPIPGQALLLLCDRL